MWMQARATNHSLSPGDGRKKSAGISGSKYIFPHVMGWPSLHIHERMASITARVIRVLALTSPRETLKKSRQSLQILCWWIKGPLRDLPACGGEWLCCSLLLSGL